ncbi:MAG: molecular chaperone TorD family protein [candidate division Zixibacteria bacterium]
MRQVTDLYDGLGGLLKYPEVGTTAVLENCLTALEESGSPALEPVSKFAEHARSSSLEELEELFTRTFDINPVCALEVGWHLFGERYERGTFIVKMRQTMRRLEIPESTELPDHLTHALEALGRMETEEANEFAHLFILPALKKMLDAQKGKENPYSSVLDGIDREVKHRYQEPNQGANHE